MSPLSPEQIVRDDLQPEILDLRNERRLDDAIHETNGRKKKKTSERLRMITVDPQRLGQILPGSGSYNIDLDELDAALSNGHVDVLSNGYSEGVATVLQPGTKPAARNVEDDRDLELELALVGNGPKKGEREVTRVWKRGGQYVIKDADPAAVIPAHQTAERRAHAVRADRHLRAKQQGGGLGETMVGVSERMDRKVIQLTHHYADWIAEAAAAPNETEAAWEAHFAEEKAKQAAAEAKLDGLYKVQDELLGADPGNEEVHIRNSSHEVRFKAFKRLLRSSADHEFHDRKRERRRSGGVRERNVAEVAGTYVTTEDQRVQDSIDEAMGRADTAANDEQVRDWKKYMAGPDEAEAEAAILAEREGRYGDWAQAKE